MRDYAAALPTPRDRDKTLTAPAERVTPPHDGGALFPGGDCFYGPSESPHFVAELDRAAAPYVAAVEPRENCPLPPADIVGLYGLRGWTEQDDKAVKHQLSWADFQFRSGQAIQREPPVVSDSRTRQRGHRPGQGHRDQPLRVTLTNNRSRRTAVGQFGV